MAGSKPIIVIPGGPPLRPVAKWIILLKNAGQIAYTFWQSILMEALAGADSGLWVIELQLVKPTTEAGYRF